MNDIIASIPWACGEPDCKAQWHKATYWAYADGTYGVDNYSDGDHETVTEDELPSPEEVETQWRAYAADVAETGDDVLGQYIAKRCYKIRERWFFRFNKSIIGPVLLSAKRGRHVYNWRELPPHVAAYLTLAGSARLQSFASWRELVEACPNAIPMRWMPVVIYHKRNRAPKTVKREIQQLARQHKESTE